MRKFLIYTYPYTRRHGGIISQYKLCHLINQLGGNAFLHPVNVELAEVNALNIAEAVQFAQNQVFDYANFSVEQFLGDSNFNTPVTHIFNDKEYGDDWIIVYPEITFGNPLRAKNVVRWLLHNPGFHNGRINYGTNELHIRFADLFDEFHHPGCKLSDNFLMIMDYDFDMFNLEGAAEDRSGTAYFVRYRWEKPIQHNLEDSVLIDSNTDQAEIARIFKRVKTFYSYDLLTAYSHLAVLCGCDSVVIPDPGISEIEWTPDENHRLGVAYGLENLEKARGTAHLVKPYLQGIKDRGLADVINFMKEADEFFG